METVTSSNPANFAKCIARVSKLVLPTDWRFFNLTPFDPPLAKIRTAVLSLPNTRLETLKLLA